MPLNGRPGSLAMILASRARLVSSRLRWSWVCELGGAVERDHKASPTRKVWDLSRR